MESWQVTRNGKPLKTVSAEQLELALNSEHKKFFQRTKVYWQGSTVEMNHGQFWVMAYDAEEKLIAAECSKHDINAITSKSVPLWAHLCGDSPIKKRLIKITLDGVEEIYA